MVVTAGMVGVSRIVAKVGERLLDKRFPVLDDNMALKFLAYSAKDIFLTMLLLEVMVLLFILNRHNLAAILAAIRGVETGP